MELRGEVKLESCEKVGYTTAIMPIIQIANEVSSHQEGDEAYSDSQTASRCVRHLDPFAAFTPGGAVRTRPSTRDNSRQRWPARPPTPPATQAPGYPAPTTGVVVRDS